MLKVGLTGGLGSGKSTASQFFESMGAYVLDADVTAKELIDNNRDVQKELVKEFGTDIIDASEKIDKKTEKIIKNSSKPLLTYKKSLDEKLFIDFLAKYLD